MVNSQNVEEGRSLDFRKVLEKRSTGREVPLKTTRAK